MDRHVKERLVGAAVLMAAAVILIPEMLSGPDRADRAAGGEDQQGAIKTYTIDLQQPQSGVSPGRGTSGPVIEERAPPPEVDIAAATEAKPARAAQADPEPQVGEGAAPRKASPPESRQVAKSAAAPVQSAEKPEAPPQKPSPEKVTRGWAVQLGSFSKQATADRLAGELRGEGHDAFVMPVRSGANTFYRVRVGPMKERAGAEAALRTLKSKAPGAAVVSHP